MRIERALNGVFLGSGAIGPHFPERRQGKIINTGRGPRSWNVRVESPARTQVARTTISRTFL